MGKSLPICTLYLYPKWVKSLYIETSPLICKANQWTGFYMIGTSIMKVLCKIRYLIRWPLRLERLCELFSKCINTGEVEKSLELLQILINEQLRVSIKSKDEVKFTISVYILSKKLSAATHPYLFEVDPEIVTVRKLKLMVSFIFIHISPVTGFYMKCNTGLKWVNV